MGTTKKVSTKIIAISGRNQSGKNTVADILEYILSKDYRLEPISYDDYLLNKDTCKEPHYFQQFSYAKSLKEIASKILGIDINLWEDENFKSDISYYCLNDNGKLYHFRDVSVDNDRRISNRDLLIYIANTLRAINPLCFVESLNYDISKSDCKVGIITDLRFQVEYAMLPIKYEDLITMQVNRDNTIDTVIEIEGNHFDINISNNNSLSELFTKVWEIYNNVIIKKFNL